ncbi:MAG: AraC family transcriptional regulator of adaptative response, partial [Paracoccaceae bacterium]
MMFDLPDHQTLYTALVTRDPSYEGRAFVGVRTTGIFCRLVCPA